MRAAIEAHEKRADVLVVCKSPAGYNNATVVSGGGFRAAMGGLTPEEHMEDTLQAGESSQRPGSGGGLRERGWEACP